MRKASKGRNGGSERGTVVELSPGGSAHKTSNVSVEGFDVLRSGKVKLIRPDAKESELTQFRVPVTGSAGWQWIMYGEGYLCAPDGTKVAATDDLALDLGFWAGNLRHVTGGGTKGAEESEEADVAKLVTVEGLEGTYAMIGDRLVRVEG